ncbi:hypothetical protein LCGC14_2170730, partial [marine sediment metagenome]
MPNRTIVPQHRTNYNYQEILGFRVNKTSWRKIAEYYGRKHPNAMNWYNRQTEKLEIKHAVKLRTKAPTRKKKESTEIVTHPRYEVRRGDRYGEYEMTEYSFIDGREVTTGLIIEWFDKFCDHLWTWNPVPEFLVEMIEETYFKDFIIVLEPRKHGKTICLLCLFAFWVIELKKTLIVIVSDHSAQKRIFFGLRHVMKKPNVRAYYGDIMDADNAGDFTIMFNPILQERHLDPFIRVASIEGTWIGSHAEWAHQEDVQQKIALSQSTRDRMIDNYDDNLQDIADKNTASATRKGELDYYGELFKRGWRPLHRKAVEFSKGDFPNLNDFIFETFEYDETEYQDPVGLTKEYLAGVEYKTLDCPNFSFLKLMIRYWRNPDSFFTQYQNEAVSRRSKFFDGTDLEVIKPFTDGRLNGHRYFFIDPAFSVEKSKTGSFVAMLIIAIVRHEIIIEDIIIRRMSPEELDDWGVLLHTQYDPNESFIENDYAQITTRSQSYQKLLNLRGMGLFINRGFGTKDQRIQSLYGYLFRSQVKIYDTAKDRIHFMRERRGYNKDAADRKSHYDGLDILSSAVRIL